MQNVTNCRTLALWNPREQYNDTAAFFKINKQRRHWDGILVALILHNLCSKGFSVMAASLCVRLNEVRLLYKSNNTYVCEVFVLQLKSRCEELKLDWGTLCLESLLKEKQALRRQISEKQRHCLELQVHNWLYILRCIYFAFLVSPCILHCLFCCWVSNCCSVFSWCNGSLWCVFVDQHSGVGEKSKAAGIAAAQILQPLWWFPLQKESWATPLHRSGL